jgi:hypothetical protein
VARKHSLTETQRSELAAWVNDLRRSREWSWREFADALTSVGGKPLTDQTVRNASLGQGSEEMLRLIEQLTGETIDTRTRLERAERFPSRKAAAAALRGLVDDEAIDAMMSEEHYGTDGDPGADFWLERAAWWNRKRKELREGFVPPSTDLDEPPPMTARPKKVNRS